MSDTTGQVNKAVTLFLPVLPLDLAIVADYTPRLRSNNSNPLRISTWREL